MRRLLNRHAKHPQTPALLIDAVNVARQSGTVTDTTLWMVQTLGQFDQPEVHAALLGWLKDGTAGESIEEPVFEIIQTLGQRNDPQSQQALIELLAHEDLRAAILAIDGLGSQRSPPAWEPIQRLVGRREYQASYAYRFSVLNAVSQYEGRQATDVLVTQLPLLNGQLKFRVVDHLTRTTGQSFGRNAQQWVQWWQTNQSLPQSSGLRTVRAHDYVWDYPLPSFYELKVYATDVVFVIDISGTMRQQVAGGLTRLERAKLELQGAIGRLPDTALFNLIAFDDEVQIWQRQSVQASLWNKEQALQVVRYLGCGSGTAIYDGLDTAMHVSANTEAMFLLSDGLPTAGRVTDEEQILRLITRQNRFRKISINTISVGRDSELLRSLSAQNHGVYRRSG